MPVLRLRRNWPARLGWGVLAVAIIGALVAVAWLTGALRAIYDWLPHMRADASQAWAAWATFGIAIVAAVVAYNQVKISRQTREEQAQPNVVMYTESTPSHWQFLDIVLKNFGTTPAYNVTVEITPELKQTPDGAGGEPWPVPFPKLTRTLAPGQDLRTNWDYAVDRENYMKKLRERKDLTPSEFRERELASSHEATVRYEDSHGKEFVMRSTLDFDLLRDTMHVTTYTVHDLTKRIEKQQKALEAIATQLGNFSQEHKGIWVYPSDADAERQYWVDHAEQLRNQPRTYRELVRQSQERRAARNRAETDTGGAADDRANSTDNKTAEQ